MNTPRRVARSNGTQHARPLLLLHRFCMQHQVIGCASLAAIDKTVFGQGPFDLACVDVNLLPTDAAAVLLRDTIPHLRPGARIVLTLKFHKRPKPARSVGLGVQ
jgi:hypothetical protein